MSLEDECREIASRCNTAELMQKRQEVMRLCYIEEISEV